MPESSNWNDVYKKRGQIQHLPDPVLKDVISLFRKNRVEKVLDLGCGTARHSIELSKAGFRVVGIDLSEVATNISEELSHSVNRVFVAGNMTDIMFPNNYFDAVFCFLVLHHAKTNEILTAVAEISRVLKKNGLFVVNFPTLNNKKLFKDAKEIEPNTFVHLKSLDGMVPHHFFSKGEITKLLGGFKILKIKNRDFDLEHEKTSWNYYFVAARKK